MNGNRNSRDPQPDPEVLLRSLQQETAQALAGWEFGPELQAKVMARVQAQDLLPQPRSRRVPIGRRPWLGAAAAAAVVAGVAILTQGEILGDLFPGKQAMRQAAQQESAPMTARALEQPQPSLAAPAAPGGEGQEAQFGITAAPAQAGAEAAAAGTMAAADADGYEQGSESPQEAAAQAEAAGDPAAAAGAVPTAPEPGAERTMGIAAVADGRGAGGDAEAGVAVQSMPGEPQMVTLDQAGQPVAVQETLAAKLDLEYIQGSSGAAGKIRATLTAEGEVPAGLVLSGLVETAAGPVTLRPARQELAEPLIKGENQSWEFTWDYRLPDGNLAPSGVYTVRVEVRTAATPEPVLTQQLLIRIVR